MASEVEQYTSGDDFIVEFLHYRYSFSRVDFEQRVTAAAIRLQLLPARELRPEEATDLVALAAVGRIERLHDESLVYWLRKLVFRSAWLDHRVKAGLLDVAFDERSGGFDYRLPTDQVPLIELAPVPSWADLQYRA